MEFIYDKFIITKFLCYLNNHLSKGATKKEKHYLLFNKFEYRIEQGKGVLIKSNIWARFMFMFDT